MTVPQKTFMRSLQVTSHGSMRMSPKQNNSPACGSSKTSQIQRKLFVEALGSRWSPVSSKILVMWRLFHLSIVERSILSGTPQFVCLKSSEKFKKRTTEDESLFTMTMRALTHRLTSAPFWLAKTLNWWVIHRAALTWHRAQRFSSPVDAVKRSKTMFWKSLNPSGKGASTSGASTSGKYFVAQ